MADPKTYVEVLKFAVKDIFDDKYKSRVIDLMTKTAEAAVDRAGGLSTDKPKEKGAKGWSVSGSLVSLGPDKSGKKFGAEVSVVVSTWPGKSMKSFPSGSAAFATSPGDKISVGDVDTVAKGAVAEAMKTAVKFMTDKQPE
jgi:hypothetical protein